MGKKWLSIAVAFLMLLVPIVAAAEDEAPTEYAQWRVCGLGIMEGDENGDLRFDEAITRAEFVTIALRLKLYGKAEMAPQDTAFSDVTAAHWASGAIAAAHALGIISGDSEGTFRPDAYVEFNEAVKILVNITGYDMLAQQLGGYPDGYFLQASRLSITDGVERKNNSVTRGQICVLLNNTLDVAPLEKIIGTENYVKNTLTLYELYQQELEIQELQGVIQETELESLLSDSVELPAGTVQLDGIVYNCAQELSDLLGFRVKGFVRANKESAHDDLVMVSLIEDQNRSWKAEPDQVEIYTDYLTVTETEGASSARRYPFASDMVCVYNGRKTDAPVRIYEGQYRGVDNNSDGQLDVLFIEETESFIVERINTDTGMLYFADQQTFRGRNGLEIRLEDPDRIYRITDKVGHALTYDEIPLGSGLTVSASQNMEYVQIWISDTQIEGKVNEVQEEGVRIGDIMYPLTKNTQGEWTLLQYLDVDQELLGTEQVFVLDIQGRIIGITGSGKRQAELFGYVTQAATAGTLDSTLKFRLLQGMHPKKEMRTVSGMKLYTITFKMKSCRISMFTHGQN